MKASERSAQKARALAVEKASLASESLKRETHALFLSRQETSRLLLERAIAAGRAGRPREALVGLDRALHASPADALVLRHAIRANIVAWNHRAPTLTTGISNPDMAHGFSFSPDGKTLFANFGILGLRGWNTLTGEPQPYNAAPAYPPPTHGQYPNGGAVRVFSPDGARFAMISKALDVQLHDLVTGARVGAPLTLREGISYFAFSGDGKRIVTFNNMRAIVWDVTHGLPAGPEISFTRRNYPHALSPFLTVSHGGDVLAEHLGFDPADGSHGLRCGTSPPGSRSENISRSHLK